MRVERELHHLHSGQAGIGQQLFHARSDVAKILGNKAQVAEPRGQHADKVHAGAGLPVSVLRGRIPVGHGPVALKAAEMIYADYIIKLPCAVYAAYPPAVAVRRHRVPVIQRVAPELAVLGERIGRHSRDLGGHIVPVQLEKLRIAPHIGGVERDIYRNIADKLHAVVMCVGVELLPLLIEEVLQENVEIHVAAQLLTVLPDGLRAVRAYGLVRPLHPAHHAEARLYRHVQRIIFHPGIFPAELRRLRRKALPAALKRAPQYLETVVVYSAVVRALLILAPVYPLEVGAPEQSVRYQHIEVYEIRVAGKGRKRRIGAVPVARGAEREQLPVFLPGSLEKIYKFICALAHAAYAVL